MNAASLTVPGPTARGVMNRRFFESIWHIRGSVPLPPDQSREEAFTRLAPLFRETGTSHECADDTLRFTKKDPAAQDKMAVFDHGELQIRDDGAGRALHYHMVSRMLLFCFLAPLLFVAFGQATILIGKYEAAKEQAAPKKPEKPPVVRTLNPIDKMLGAPAPEAPKKDKKPEGKKASATSAYVFAGIFAFLYLVGRILEQRAIRRTLGRRLAGE